MILADVIIHCTGYKYCFPFLHTGGVVTNDDNRVGPLYKHVFPPTLAPSLSFVGIPNMVLFAPSLSYVNNFPLYEFQSKWIAGVLSKRLSLPSKDMMMQDIKGFYIELEAKGAKKSDTHKIHDFMISYPLVPLSNRHNLILGSTTNMFHLKI
ncbi:Flavin-containing monooxygenase FMO GS-OX-like 2 [Bienertia sinuspersici]